MADANVAAQATLWHKHVLVCVNYLANKNGIYIYIFFINIYNILFHIKKLYIYILQFINIKSAFKT